MSIIENIRGLFHNLGFITQRLDIDSLALEKSVKTILLSTFPDSHVTQYLNNFPAFIAVHREAEPQHSTILVDVKRDREISKIISIGNESFPIRIIIIEINESDKFPVKVKARLFEKEEKSKLLLPLLEELLLIKFPKSLIERVIELGYIVE